MYRDSDHPQNDFGVSCEGGDFDLAGRADTAFDFAQGWLCPPLLTLILLEERPLREIRGAKPDSRGGCLFMVSRRA
jgi:hypothetical protein